MKKFLNFKVAIILVIVGGIIFGGSYYFTHKSKGIVMYAMSRQKSDITFTPVKKPLSETLFEWTKVLGGFLSCGGALLGIVNTILIMKRKENK